MGKIKLLLGAFFVFVSAATSAAPIYFDFTDEKYTFLNGKQDHIFEIDGVEVLTIRASTFLGEGSYDSSSPKIKWTPNGLGIGGPFSGDDVLCEYLQDPFAVDDLCLSAEAFFLRTPISETGYVLNSAIFAKADSGAKLGASIYHDTEGEQNVDSPGELLIRIPDPEYTWTDITYLSAIGDVSFVLQGISIGIPEELEAYYSVPAPAAIWLFGSGLIGLIGFTRRRKAAN